MRFKCIVGMIARKRGAVAATSETGCAAAAAGNLVVDPVVCGDLGGVAATAADRSAKPQGARAALV